VLLGLGNDYGILLYSRYREMRATGLSMDEAIVAAWDRSGGPAFTAALTAAAGFLSLLSATFQGFQQLGIVIGAGVPFCFLAVVLLMPLLIRWTNPPVAATVVQNVDSHITRGKVGYWVSIPVLLLGVFLTAVGAWAMTQVPFDYDLSALRRQGMAFAELAPEEQKLAQESYSPIIISYDTMASMEQDYVRIRQEIADGKFPEVVRVMSTLTVIPSDAAKRADLLREIATLSQGDNLQYLPEAIRRNLQQLINLSPGEDYELKLSDLPDSLRSILGASSGHHRMLVIPTGNMWDLRQCAAMGEALQEHLPGRSIAGEYVSLGTLYRLIRSDAPRIIVVAFVIVMLLLLVDMRDVRRMGWAMLVQVGGMVCAAGVLVALRLQLNLVNFVAIPILVGTGIETGIFLIHRLKEEGYGGVRKALLTTGLASSLCTITTLLAFASLILASSRGVRSLGQVIVAGDATVAIVAFLLLPAGAALRYFIKERRQRVGPLEG